MSLFERLFAWLRSIFQSPHHQYRQEADWGSFDLKPVDEQRLQEEIHDSAFAARRAKYASTEELWNCWEILSPREQEVTALICLGYTNNEIAQRLGVSSTTVKSHIRNILAKFQMHSKIELRIALKEWDFSHWN